MLVLLVEYKENEQARLTCRMCAALAHLLISKVQERRLMILENVLQNEKWPLLHHYFVCRWMENQNVPIDTWNINKHRHRTNRAVKGWNYKLNSITGKQRPNVFLQAQKLIEETDLVSWQPKWREPGQPVKTKKCLCNTRREN